jgi:hypothetical protein
LEGESRKALLFEKDHLNFIGKITGESFFTNQNVNIMGKSDGNPPFTSMIDDFLTEAPFSSGLSHHCYI